MYLTTPTAAAKHLQLLKDTTKFAAAFTTPKLKTIAEQLWQQLGRAGPPMFLKVRTRDALQQVDQVRLNYYKEMGIEDSLHSTVQLNCTA